MNPVEVKVLNHEEEDARGDHGPPGGQEAGLGAHAQQVEDRVGHEDEGKLDEDVIDEELSEAPLIEGPVVGLLGLQLVPPMRGQQVGDQVRHVEHEVQHLCAHIREGQEKGLCTPALYVG